MSKLSCNFYSQDDLLNINRLDFEVINNITEKALLEFNAGNILFPEKIVQIFDQETQDRINVLPATLLKDKVCGVKWVSVFPKNPHMYGVQNLSAVIVLSEIITGFPIAIMDGTLISNMRTASVSAIAAKYLSRSDSKTLGFIGAGEQAKMHLLSLINVRHSIEIVKISSRTTESTKLFIDQMSKYVPHITFIDCGTDLKSAISDSDIIVTATSAQAPLLKADWIKKGAFYTHVGGWEDEYDVVRKATKIVCDDWDMVKHRTQTLSRMYKEGLLNDNDVHSDLHLIVSKNAESRTSKDDLIYFNSVGLSYVDISISNFFHCVLSEMNKGERLTLQNKDIFN